MLCCIAAAWHCNSSHRSDFDGTLHHNNSFVEWKVCLSALDGRTQIWLNHQLLALGERVAQRRCADSNASTCVTTVSKVAPCAIKYRNRMCVVSVPTYRISTESADCRIQIKFNSMMIDLCQSQTQKSSFSLSQDAFVVINLMGGACKWPKCGNMLVKCLSLRIALTTDWLGFAHIF